jgi:hypothetical protein
MSGAPSDNKTGKPVEVHINAHLYSSFAVPFYQFNLPVQPRKYSLKWPRWLGPERIIGQVTRTITLGPTTGRSSITLSSQETPASSP